MKKYFYTTLVLILGCVVYLCYTFPNYFFSNSRIRENNYIEYLLSSRYRYSKLPLHKGLIQIKLEDQKKYEEYFDWYNKVQDSENWESFRNTLSLASKDKDQIIKPATHILDEDMKKRFFIIDSVARKIHLKAWNKQKNGKKLLTETISHLILGSFAVKSDTFWMPIAMETTVKNLVGIDFKNQFSCSAELNDNNELETSIFFQQNISAAKKTTTIQNHIGGHSHTQEDLCFTLFVGKIISKKNKFTIVNDKELNEARFGKIKSEYKGEEIKYFGLENLHLDPIEIGSIEVELNEE